VAIPYQTVVALFAKFKYSSRLRTGWSGSGTIISPDGLILTNAHLVLPPSRSEQPDFFAIALTLRPEQPPVEMYYAEVVEADEDLDLAVLRITTDLEYRPVDPASLGLPYVPLGDSDTLRLGDPLLIVGYPGIGGKTITAARGEVGGFSGTRKYGERTFIKTTASVTGGMSGGMVMDQNGYMVGIPTQIGNGVDEVVVDCRVVADTDGNGRIGNGDMCIPTGGFVNALRPINLAMPMIQAAIGATSSATTSTETPIGTPAVTLTAIPTATLP
jgi:S1-C subfamily serine protease